MACWPVTIFYLSLVIVPFILDGVHCTGWEQKDNLVSQTCARIDEDWAVLPSVLLPTNGLVITNPFLSRDDSTGPSMFHLFPYLIWDPVIHGKAEMTLLTCPQCGSGLMMTDKWTTPDYWRKPRLLYDMDTCMWLVTKVYQCKKNSEHRILGHHPTLLRTTSPPFILTHQNGYANTLHIF